MTETQKQQLSDIAEALKSSNLFTGLIKIGFSNLSRTNDEKRISSLHALLSKHGGLMEVAQQIRAPAERGSASTSEDRKKSREVSKLIFGKIMKMVATYILFEAGEAAAAANSRSFVPLRLDWKQNFVAYEGDVKQEWTLGSFLRRISQSKNPGQAPLFGSFFRDLQVAVFNETDMFLVDSSTTADMHRFTLHWEMASILRWNRENPTVSEFALPPASIVKLPLATSTEVKFTSPVYLDDADETEFPAGTTGTVEASYERRGGGYFYDVLTESGAVNVSEDLLEVVTA